LDSINTFLSVTAPNKYPTLKFGFNPAEDEIDIRLSQVPIGVTVKPQWLDDSNSLNNIITGTIEWNWACDCDINYTGPEAGDVMEYTYGEEKYFYSNGFEEDIPYIVRVVLSDGCQSKVASVSIKYSSTVGTSQPPVTPVPCNDKDPCIIRNILTDQCEAVCTEPVKPNANDWYDIFVVFYYDHTTGSRITKGHKKR
jgi:hypothetical protein